MIDDPRIEAMAQAFSEEDADGWKSFKRELPALAEDRMDWDRLATAIDALLVERGKGDG